MAILRSYRIKVGGRLSDRFVRAFDGVSSESSPGATILVGHAMDQAKLFGILDRVRDFGLELLSVEAIDH